MDLLLGAEHLEFRNSLKEPLGSLRATPHSSVKHIWNELKSSRLFGCMIEKKYGGGGLGLTAMCLGVEDLVSAGQLTLLPIVSTVGG